MVSQRPNPFPKSIYENIAIGVKAHFGLHGSELEGRIEKALHDAALWHEVKDTMNKSRRLHFRAVSNNACASLVPSQWNRAFF